MSKDTSLEDIDIVKLLAYILVFVVVCLVMIFAFIVPNIKEYKEINLQHRSQMASVTKISQIHSSKTANLNEMKEKQKQVFKAFETKFNKANFSSFAGKFFSDVTLQEVGAKESKEKFLRYELNVTTSLNTPSKFYQFIDALQRYDNIIKVDFPIKMHADKDKIHTTFNIKVYAKPDK
ncbi:hypothetical protein [Campylobacter sp.]|uniref:hypothetical protein n=1 Tax=Campylobacter sp. TaxID=205 RepID=UPI0026F82081|nr:hypothetical protein [Campylobacter sp.]